MRVSRASRPPHLLFATDATSANTCGGPACERSAPRANQNWSARLDRPSGVEKQAACSRRRGEEIAVVLVAPLRRGALVGPVEVRADTDVAVSREQARDSADVSSHALVAQEVGGKRGSFGSELGLVGPGRAVVQDDVDVEDGNVRVGDLGRPGDLSVAASVGSPPASRCACTARVSQAGPCKRALG